MESKGRVYQDFEPSMEWVPEDDSDTLLVYLPGFAKEQLRVQLKARNLIISGERKLHQNTWSRFRVEFPVSVNCDLNKISAKFEGSILFVRQPKSVVQKPEDESKTAAVDHIIKPKQANNVEKKQVAVGKDDHEDAPKTVEKYYKRPSFVMKLKTCCNGTVSTVVFLVVGLAIAIYVSDSIKFKT
ncbi:hypothetical protein R6Q59_005004 [Mikania micrantha]|uniref:SHSP domain-containing protein n=1 Tax=Mikania micrantha TaxID=192012 RepID=A0A5N6PYU9_9ASTR|nr:hypothetical protein E3N88_05246 [Mikania micrantha]